MLAVIRYMTGNWNIGSMYAFIKCTLIFGGVLLYQYGFVKALVALFYHFFVYDCSVLVIVRPKTFPFCE